MHRKSDISRLPEKESVYQGGGFPIRRKFPLDGKKYT